MCFFCFKQKTAYEIRISDWSSDVCSSDLVFLALGDLGLCADVLQQGAQERLLQGKAGDIEVARGLHPDLAGGAGEEVVQGAVAGLAESLGEGDDRLAPAAELGDRDAQLLNLGDDGIAPAGPRSDEHTAELQSIIRI